MVPENKQTEDTNKLTLLTFKIIAILHNTLLTTFIKLLEIVSKGLFRNRSQNRCHTFLDCHHVCKTCAFHYALQAGKQKEVHPPYSPDLAPAGAGNHEKYFSFPWLPSVAAHVRKSLAQTLHTS
jgi:hypothetical protein